MHKPCLLFILLLIPLFCSAQLEKHIWFLGGGNETRAGIRFDETTNVPESYGDVRFPLQLQENNVIITDPISGEIQLYTDGQSVVDGTHQVMPNGDQLLGSPSTMYGTAVTLDPTSCNAYLAFYVQDEFTNPPRRAYYSRIDLDAPGNGTQATPLGDVDPTLRNVPLLTGADDAAEGIYAIPKSENSRESWVFIGFRNTNTFRIYDVSESGVREHGRYDFRDFFPGEIANNERIFATRFLFREAATEREQDQLVIAVSRMEDRRQQVPIGIFPFDRANGTIQSAPANVVATDGEWIYGLALSPDESKLYYSDYFRKQLYQYDFLTGQLNLIGTSPLDTRSGGLALAPDGKIYWANIFAYRGSAAGQPVRHLASINRPNEAGTACDLEYEAIVLEATVLPRLMGALPTFGSFPLPARAQVLQEADCSVPGQAVVTPGAGEGPFGYRWDNGETTDTARQLSPGEHSVTVTSPLGCTETLTVSIASLGSTVSAPAVSGPGSICVGDTLVLSASTAATGSLTWILPDGSIDNSPELSVPISEVSEGGVYRVVTQSDDCVSDTTRWPVNVFSPAVPVTLDTTVCQRRILLEISPELTPIAWDDGETAFPREVTQSDQYGYDALDVNGCPVSGQITVDLAPDIPIDLPDAVSADFCQLVVLDPGVIAGRNLRYQWTGNGIENPASRVQQIQAIENTTIELVVIDEDAGCTVRDSVLVRVARERGLYIPNAFSPNGDGINDGFTVYHKSNSTVIEQLDIYDRWGGHAFQAREIPVNEPDLGWLGKVDDQAGDVAVFVYVVRVRFVDGATEEYSGNVFLVR